MSKYIHADLLTQYAQISQTDNAPWAHFQYREYNDEEWSDCTGPVQFWFDHEYRLKPKTIKIGDIEIPEPARNPPEYGTKYYQVVINCNGQMDILFYLWKNSIIDNAKLENGLIHFAPKAAELHAKALISLTAKK
ncbi:hypothetical protein J8V57_01385 [Xenorhabdus sp. PB61.4]|uniref:hypothetical protein n=1 Tax=Xenorhabdus sp. PB61.4 TaxID=2788940 RepID=UPI001E336C23|nr:hypothetical protein [Xenorhabdus sp. PB61.4]MCC8364943.1 hypothetical protein [Xenorhabdus sp. PB61.4]